jgi:hypothetical protein
VIPGPPENKAVRPIFLGRLSVPQPIDPSPRDDAPHAAKPGQRRRARPPVRDVQAEGLKAKVKDRREHKPE